MALAPSIPVVRKPTNMAAPAQPTAATAAPLGTDAALVGQPAAKTMAAPGVADITAALTGARDQINQALPGVGKIVPPKPVAPPPPPDTAAADKAAADAAEKARIKVAADAAKKAAEDKIAEDKAEYDAAVAAQAAATAASGVAPVKPETPPEQAKILTAAQQQFEDLVAKANEWMNAKEDPASKLAFSKAIIDSAMSNQAAMDAAKMQIASNPALAGQGAGNALLALRASQLGMAEADLRANLAINEQRAIAELNQKGFDAVMKLNEIRKSEDEKNLSSYGSALDEMIKGGADDAALEDFFNNNIKPLLPGGGAGLTLDMFRNPATRANLLQTTRTATQTALRQAIAGKQDLTTLQQLITAGWTEQQLTDIGTDWMNGKSLEDINAGLVEAGFEPVESMADLVGNEDLLGQASLINTNRAEINRQPYQDDLDDTLELLTGMGYDLTPELEASVKAYIIQQSLPGADVNDVPPWRDDATAHLYDSWPLPGKSEFEPGAIEESPASALLYGRNAAIDSLWEQYLASTAGDTERLTRKDWYSDLVKNNPGVADGSKSATEIRAITPTKTTPKPAKVDREVAEVEGKRLLGIESDVASIDFEDPDIKAYLASIQPTLPAQIKSAKTFAKANIGQWINIGGKYYRVDNGYERAYEFDDKFFGSGSNDYKHKSYMEVTGTDGKKVYVSSDGRTTTTPPPAGGESSGAKSFKSWYDSMKAA